MNSFATNNMNCIPVSLEAGYIAQIDSVDKFEWQRIIEQFSDANIYQTWSYDAIRCGEESISHLVLRVGGKICAAAQARILRLPLLGLGAAYIRWGPIWQLRNQIADRGAFRFAVRALRNEYVCRRGLILRLFPVLYDDNSDLCHDILLKEGYSRVRERDRPRTFILDIGAPIEELRKRMDQKWRNCLNRAERNLLEVIEGTEESLFVEFIGIYQDLLRRKRFAEPNDINEFRLIQRDLPGEFKMRIFLCRSNGLTSAGAICTAMGETGVYLFGATNDQGMANKGSYLLQLKAIQWMKNSGCRYYNLNGINPVINPGTYHFKAGLSGKCGKDVHYLGHFDCYSSVINAALARAAEWVFPLMKKVISISA
jgi:lipid II:glycine glycyltransferase (peptidoglycan interpeptide bridge formation enzyme)